MLEHSTDVSAMQRTPSDRDLYITIARISRQAIRVQKVRDDARECWLHPADADQVDRAFATVLGRCNSELDSAVGLLYGRNMD